MSIIGPAFLLQYYTDTALIGAGAVATMFLVCRVFDGISDLVMGAVVDKTRTKWGKARPWLMLSGPLSLIGIYLLMNVPLGMSEGGKLVYAYATYIFMAVIVYTIYGIANTALLPLMSRDHGETTMLATFSAVGNNLIGLIAGASITPLVLNFGWQKASLILGLVACVMILFSAFLNKETATENDDMTRPSVPMKEQLPAVLKNRYFWLLLLIGTFSLLMNANAIGAQIYFCNLVIGNPMFMSTLMTAGQLPGLIILFKTADSDPDYSYSVYGLIDFFGATQWMTDALFADIGPDAAESEWLGKDVSAMDKADRDAIDPLNELDTADVTKVWVSHGSADTTMPILNSQQFYDGVTSVLGEDNTHFEILEGAVHEDDAFYTAENLTQVSEFLN
ncbi:MAG: MFS transporter [Lachnospiraceae bacterium]|nr:MFS transporter [Lachnospiraceae bacterium]